MEFFRKINKIKIPLYIYVNEKTKKFILGILNLCSQKIHNVVIDLFQSSCGNHFRNLIIFRKKITVFSRATFLFVLFYHSQQLRRSARTPRPFVAGELKTHQKPLLMMWMGVTLSLLSLKGRE